MKTLYKVQEAYANKEYDVDLDFPRLNRYKEFHVFDEEKSVKWNREEVERQNTLIQEAKDNWWKEKGRLQKCFHEDMVEAIQNDYKFNEAQAKKIFEYVYKEYHSNIGDVFMYVDEICDLFEDLMKEK